MDYRPDNHIKLTPKEKSMRLGEILFAAIVAMFLLALTARTHAVTVKPVCKDLGQNRFHCEVTFPRTIVSTDNYSRFYKMLKVVGKGDTVVINLSGFGGNAHLMLELGNAIKSSRALTIAKVTGPVYSAHAFLALTTNKLEAGQLTFLMFHKMRSSTGGLTNITPAEMCRSEIKIERCIANTKSMQDAFHKVLLDNKLRDILTKEELKKFHDGYDVYLLGSDIMRRLSR